MNFKCSALWSNVCNRRLQLEKTIIKLNNVLYREALPRGPTPPSYIYAIFDRKGTPFVYL